MNAQSSFRQKMYMDFTFDRSMLKVFVPMLIIAFVLYVLCFKSPDCKILFYLVWYAGMALLLLTDRRQVEITPHMIIVRRAPFDHVVIDKKDIKKAEILKNTGIFYRASVIFLSAMTVYLAYNSFNDIIYEVQDNTTSGVILLVLDKFMIISLIAIISILQWAKRSYPALLKVDTGKSSIIFYTRKPGELKKIIELQETA